MTTAQVVEMPVTVNNNSPIQDYVHPDDETQPTFEFIFTYQIQHKGFLSTIWFVYGLNYAQNSILHRLRGAWNVFSKNSINFNKPNFFELILITGWLK